MSKEKAARRKAAGPSMDPAAISYGMSPLPGSPAGPGNMNGNPMNVTSFGPQAASMNQGGAQENIYRDGAFNYPQTGADILNPLMVPRSQVPQNAPVVSRGNNAGIPFGMQQQPSRDMADPMEGMRLSQQAAVRGLQAVPGMGLTGVSAMQGQMMPGALAANMPGTSGPPMLPPMTSMNPMTPGATPQKNPKKKGKK